jgi:hypothetical protein
MTQAGRTRSPATHRAPSSTATIPAETPAASFAALRDCFAEAAELAGGVTTHAYDVGGAPLRIHTAGPALVPHLTRALAHLPIATGGDGALTIRAWDDASTGVSTPIDARLQPRNGDGSFRAASPAGDLRVIAEHGRVEMLDLDRGEALYWVDAAARIPWYESAVPLQSLVEPWTADRGLRFVHAGAVGRGDGCVLIVGPSGAGKSTTALACLESELRYLADDFCLVRSDDATVFSIYNSAKATDETAARLPRLIPMLARPGAPEEKWLAFLHEHMPDRLLHRAGLRAIVVPRVTGRTASALIPVGRGAALANLVPSSLRDSSQREDGFRRLAALAAAVPSYSLELGTDLDTIPPLLATLLDG